MAIALEGRLHWRMTAPYHVQLQLDKETEPLRVPSTIVVQGTVVRVFRSDTRLSCGDRVGFKIWICQPGDEPTGPAFVYCKPFMQATHVEVYLHGNPPSCELAAYEFALISVPTDQPTMSVAELQDLASSSVPTSRQPVPQNRSLWGRILRRRL